MPIDPSVFSKIQTFPDYQRADQEFQMRRALAAQQLQSGDTQNQLQQFQLQHAKATAAANLLSTVNDESSYQAAKQQAPQLGVDPSTLPANYDPNYIKAATSAALDVKDRAALALDQAKLDETTRHNKADEYNQSGGWGTSPTTNNPPAATNGTQAGQVTPPPTTNSNVWLPSMATVESGNNPNAISSAGAAGTYQIMPETAKNPGFGVKPLQNWDGLDPRTAPQDEQKRFANDYANAMVNRYHDQRLGLAAYNAGAGNVDVAQQASGGNYQGTMAALPQETQNYVPKVMGGAQAASTPTQQKDLNSLTGDDFLAALKAQYPGAPTARIKAIIDGDSPPPNPYGLAKSPAEQKVMNAVFQADPTYNANRYTAMQQFTNPNSKTAQSIKSFNVGLAHLDTLSNLADALSNGDVKAVNAIGNTYQAQTGSPAPTNFEAAKQIVGDEIIKAIVGAGGGVGDRDKAQAQISAANSPEQLHGVIDTYKSLMKGQLGGIEQQYQNSTGKSDFTSRMLTPEARAVYTAQPASNGGASQANLPTVTTRAQWSALEPGTPYIGRDGQQYTKGK